MVTGLSSTAVIQPPSGTLVNGKRFYVRITDNGIARLISFHAFYSFSLDDPPPGSTIANKTLYVGFIYNSAKNKAECVSIRPNIG